MPEIYDKGPGEKLLILETREWHVYPFDAEDWTDLRLGMFLSLTQAVAPDTITGLADSIGPNPTLLGSADRYWIGVKDNSSIFPAETGSVFAGYTNAGPESREPTFGNSQLLSSDNGIGTTNSNFWRPCNGTDGSHIRNALISDGINTPAHSGDGCQAHFIQNVGGAGGYATMLALRLQRPDASSNLITVSLKTGTHNGDVIYSSTPSETVLLANLDPFPTPVQILGPVALSQVPSALYFYWPFSISRLRIHSVQALSVA